MVYTKAIAVSSAAMFTLLWCTLGLDQAMLLAFYTFCFLMAAAATIAVVTTLTFMFYDWKNKHSENVNSAKRTRYSSI